MRVNFIIFFFLAIWLENITAKTDILPSTHTNLLRFMASTQNLQMQNPSISMECFNYYIPLLNAVASDFEVNYEKCLNESEYNSFIIEKSAKPIIQQLNDNAIEICQKTKECDVVTEAIESFECYENTGAENTKAFYNISVIAQEQILIIQEQYNKLKTQEQSCIDLSEHIYITTTASTYDDLQKCLSGTLKVPHETTTTSAPTTEFPTTTVLPHTPETETTAEIEGASGRSSPTTQVPDEVTTQNPDTESTVTETTEESTETETTAEIEGASGSSSSTTQVPDEVTTQNPDTESTVTETTEESSETETTVTYEEVTTQNPDTESTVTETTEESSETKSTVAIEGASGPSLSTTILPDVGSTQTVQTESTKDSPDLITTVSQNSDNTNSATSPVTEPSPTTQSSTQTSESTTESKIGPTFAPVPPLPNTASEETDRGMVDDDGSSSSEGISNESQIAGFSSSARSRTVNGRSGSQFLAAIKEAQTKVFSFIQNWFKTT